MRRLDAAPLVSVVVPVYNCERFLAQAITSVLGQSFEDFELIVVDDGSTDGTPSVLREFAASDNRVRPIRTENRGFPLACNLGTELARGRYIAHLDADDVACPGRLEAQVDFLETDRDYVLVGTNLNVINESGCVLPHSKAFYTSNEDLRKRLPFECPFTHSAVMMRADACRDSGGYRSAFATAEDYDLWVRISRFGKVANLPIIGVQWRRHGSQTSNKRLEQQMVADCAVKYLVRRLECGEPDPFLDIEHPLRRADLIQAGMSAAQIDQHILDGYELWANQMWKDGDEEESLRLWERTWSFARASDLPNDRKARYGAILFARNARAGRFLKALQVAGSVLRTEPQYPLSWLKRRAGR